MRRMEEKEGFKVCVWLVLDRLKEIILFSRGDDRVRIFIGRVRLKEFKIGFKVLK